MTAIVEQRGGAISTMNEADLIGVLSNSLYPGANPHSVQMVLSYCKASGLDPMQKPVHIVPLWDGKAKQMRDVVMPGVGLYCTQASRTGHFAGMSEPEFGPDVTDTIGGVEITYPSWCKVVAKRLLSNGMIAEFTAVERWKENYAVKGGPEKSIAPNAMWSKRPYGQLAKCAEAQVLRKAFPEIGSQPTAEEVEGKPLHEEIDVTPTKNITMPKSTAAPIEETSAGEPVKPADDVTELASAGEIAYINKKLGPMTEDALSELGIGTIDNLSKSDFNRLKDWAMKK